jgi:hypothetical protein
MLAEPFLGVLRASHVWHARIVRHVPRLLDKFIDTSMVTTIAGSSHFHSTIKDELDRKINVIALSLAGNFDSIGKTAQRTMGPATTTVLYKRRTFIRI